MSNALGFFQMQADSTMMLEIISADYPPMNAQVPAANSFKIELTRANTLQKEESVAEEMPSFPGGYPAFYEYLQLNMNLPREVKNGSITGKVFVEFVIERDGQISPDDINITQSLCKPCDEEAVRLIKESPNWNPGTQNGRPVRTRMVLPVPFR